MDAHYTTRNGATAARLIGSELMYLELGDMTNVVEVRFGIGVCIDPTVLGVQNPYDGSHEDTFMGFSEGWTGSNNLPQNSAQVATTSSFLGCGQVDSAEVPTGWSMGQWLSDKQNAGRVQPSNYNVTMQYCHTRCTTFMPKFPPGKASVPSIDTFPHTQNLSFSGHPTIPSVSIYVVAIKKLTATTFNIARSIPWGPGSIFTDTGAGARAAIDNEIVNRVNNFWVLDNSSVLRIEDVITCGAGHTPESVIQALKCAVIQWPLSGTPLFAHNAVLKKITG